jgi:hypothetical protein
MCAPVPMSLHFWLEELVTMTYVATAVHHVLRTRSPASFLFRSVIMLDVTICCLFMCLHLLYRWKHAAEKVMEIPSPGSARHSFTRPLRGGSLYDETPLIGTVIVHTGSQCCPSISSLLNNYRLSTHVLWDVVLCPWASCLHHSEGS